MDKVKPTRANIQVVGRTRVDNPVTEMDGSSTQITRQQMQPKTIPMRGKYHI
jgi:hypothetical protein